jgi:formamidopyrimidine-DNA glycosylase
VPELPEVETMRRGVLAVIGARIERVALPRRQDLRPLSVSPAPRTFQRRLKGQTIAAVERHGKRLALRLAGDERVVFEPRMTGLALLSDPPTTKHVRARFDLSGVGVERLVFWDRRGLGTLRLLDPKAFDEAVTARLGPDALTLGPQDLAQRLQASRRPLKVALLDQGVVAGIGNIYAAEALHAARIDPTRPCRELTLSEWRRLTKRLVNILEQAVRYEGSTLGDGTYRNALNQDGSYQSCHQVYAREGLPCLRRRCAGSIARIVQSQRATFYCPKCQT